MKEANLSFFHQNIYAFRKEGFARLKGMESNMKIIFNADDYGYSKGVNLGIIEAYENGLVRSATMMANMPSFEHGVALWKSCSGLKIGVHLVLTTGASLGGVYNTITDNSGNFLRLSEIVQRANANTLDLSEVEKEYTLQIEKILAAGIPITHLDGHHHTQNLPGNVQVLLALAKKYNIPVRANDRVLANSHGVKSPVFDETFHGDNVTMHHLEHILSSCKETTEIMCHPAYLDNFVYSNSSYNIQRIKELEILTCPSAKMLVEKYSHTLGDFQDL